MHNRNWVYGLVILLTVLGVLLPISPRAQPVPAPDESVYFYISSRLLDGQVPYRDAWDHKQPLTYFLFALALAPAGGSLWGVWTLRLVFLTVTGWAAFALLRRAVPRFLALLAVLAGLLTLLLLVNGTAVEELALPFQVLTLACLAGLAASPDRRSRLLALGFAAGALTGITFFLKQSLIALGLSMAVYLTLRILIRREWKHFWSLAAMGGGFALVAGLVAGYFWANGALADYLDAAFTFNLAYTKASLFTQLNYTLDALEMVSTIPGLFVAFLLWTAGLIAVLLQSGPSFASLVKRRAVPALLLVLGAGLVLLSLGWDLLSRKPGFGIVQAGALLAGLVSILAAGALSRPHFRKMAAAFLAQAPLDPHPEQTSSGRLLWALLAVAEIAFPLILFSIGLSGRNYLYYFISLVPALILLAGAVGGVLLRSLTVSPARRMAWTLILALFVGLAYNPALLLNGLYRRAPEAAPTALLDIVSANSSRMDTIYVWGMSADVYVLAGRAAPTRYFYLAPFYADPYGSDHAVFETLLGDLQRSPPALFIQPAETASPLDETACRSVEANSGGWEAQIQAFLCAKYRFLGTFDGYAVYRRLS